MPATNIPTSQLTATDLPPDNAELEDLIRFAYTFDGHQHWDSISRCAEIANARDHGSLEKLRTCLFFEVRRWRQYGDLPDEETVRYCRSLVAEIRQRLVRP